MTPEQRSRLGQVTRTWVHEPLVANGFRRLKPRLWIHEHPISAVVKLWTRRGEDQVVLFTLEWGFFSPHFAAARHYSPEPDSVTSALRAPIGRLIGDGRFDIWWAVHPDGRITREAPFEHRDVDANHDDEVREAITRRLVPFAHSITTADDIASRLDDLRAVLSTGLVDADRTLDLIRGGAVEPPAPWAAVEFDSVADLPVVHVEDDEPGPGLLVSFDDEVAHLHEDLVKQCLHHCRQFPGVRSAEWPDREIIHLSGEGIDGERLQVELLELVLAALDARAAEDASIDDGVS